MAGTVLPRVYLVGATAPSYKEIERYLKDTNQTEFEKEISEALRDAQISDGLILCSMFAKLCYKSLVVGKNANVTKTRSIRKNVESCFEVGHGSVFEHCNLNFLVTDCSRIFTHELVRHRVGTAYSQTSGRYCRLDEIDLVWDPVLDPVKDLFLRVVRQTEDAVYLAECQLGLRRPPDKHRNAVPMDGIAPDYQWQPLGVTKEDLKWVPDDSFDFEKRKKVTSAIRRIAPNGQSNEIAFSVNVRALRHLVQVRTAAAAEWEIRYVFDQVYKLVKSRWPLMFHGAREKVVDGLIEVSGMRQQPYDYISPEAV